MALPSISEDDENQSEGECSPWASPLHSTPLLKPTKKHPRRKLLRRGNTLSSLRDRIVRQPLAITNSNESLKTDDEEVEETSKKQETAKTVGKVDTELITLHQNVTQLSIEVRNAIQALQDFTFSSIQSQADLNSRFPARSIPNISNEIESRSVDIEHSSMVRSTSHPPEMWGREMSTDSANIPDPFEKLGLDFLRKPSMSYNLPEVSSGTQTEDCDYETIQRIVRSNPRLVLSILGRNLMSKYHQMSLSTITEMSRENLCDLLTEESGDDPANAHNISSGQLGNSSRRSPDMYGNNNNNHHNHNEMKGHKSNENNHIKTTRHKVEKHVSIVEEIVTGAATATDNNKIIAGSNPSSPVVDDGPMLAVIDAGTSNISGHGESCVIILNEDDIDVVPEGSVKKRYNNLIIKKTPLSNRFSAGDADALEKGVVPTMPSTRSLKEI